VQATKGRLNNASVLNPHERWLSPMRCRSAASDMSRQLSLQTMLLQVQRHRTPRKTQQWHRWCRCFATVLARDSQNSGESFSLRRRASQPGAVEYREIIYLPLSAPSVNGGAARLESRFTVPRLVGECVAGWEVRQPCIPTMRCSYACAYVCSAKEQHALVGTRSAELNVCATPAVVRV